jgi:uncharacterized membrane protein
VKNYTAATALPSVKAALVPVMPRLNPATLSALNTFTSTDEMKSPAKIVGLFLFPNSAPRIAS